MKKSPHPATTQDEDKTNPQTMKGGSDWIITQTPPKNYG